MGFTEIFVDGKVLEKIYGGAALRIHAPVLKEVAVTVEKPWEWLLGYPSVIPDGKGGYFLYYRGSGTSRTYKKDEAEKQVTCVCHSPDGINFDRVNAGVFPWEGSCENNIVYTGVISHNFTPFYDTNPECPPSQRFKAVGGLQDQGNGGLNALASEDGVHWRLLSDKPVLTSKSFAFDSQNVAFFDSVLGKYHLYSRYWHNMDRGWSHAVRSIQSCVSDDFIHWSDPVPNDYGEEITEQFYINAVWPCPEAENILLSFPARFLPKRKRVAAHDEDGTSDAVFMASRDGVNWTRLFKESWLRPGCDEANWTDRNMYIGAGIIETNDGNFSLFCTEHNYCGDNRIRRVVIRKHGFVSLSAGWETGIGVTKPFLYEGGKLRLNYSTSAAGYVKAWLMEVEASDIAAAPENAFELFGDAIDEVYPLVAADGLTGKSIRLCFELKDADLYSFRFEHGIEIA